MSDLIEEISPEDGAGVSRMDQRQANIRQALLELPPDECMEFVRATARIELEVRSMAVQQRPTMLAKQSVRMHAPQAWMMARLAQYAFNVIMEAEHGKRDFPAG